MTIHLLVCRGIGERPGVNMILGDGLGPGVIGRLPDGEAFFVDEVRWRAAYGPVPGPLDAISYGRSLDEGMDLISAKLANLPEGDTAILLGFSGGATLAGNYARFAIPGVHHREKIVGVGLIADPMRPVTTGRDEHSGQPVGPGFGIGGQRFIPEDDFPVWWISNPRDVICCCPMDSPLRTIADQTFAMSFSPGGAPLWLADLVDRLKTRRWQAVRVEWWRPARVFEQYARAVDDAAGYLFRGEHISYDRGDTPGTQTLANRIINRARQLGEL